MPNKIEPVRATVIGVRDYGPLVIVFLNGEEGRVLPVIYEQRRFQHFLEGKACCPDELLGRRVIFNGETLDLED